MILFHFGLGGELDLNFIKNTNLPSHLKPSIIPGKSYCIVEFSEEEEAGKYLSQEFFRPIIEHLHTVRYAEVQFQNLSRLIIAASSSK